VFLNCYPSVLLEVMSKTGKNVSIAGDLANCQECNTNIYQSFLRL